MVIALPQDLTSLGDVERQQLHFDLLRLTGAIREDHPSLGSLTINRLVHLGTHSASCDDTGSLILDGPYPQHLVNSRICTQFSSIELERVLRASRRTSGAPLGHNLQTNEEFHFAAQWELVSKGGDLDPKLVNEDADDESEDYAALDKATTLALDKIEHEMRTRATGQTAIRDRLVDDLQAGIAARLTSPLFHRVDQKSIEVALNHISGAESLLHVHDVALLLFSDTDFTSKRQYSQEVVAQRARERVSTGDSASVNKVGHPSIIEYL